MCFISKTVIIDNTEPSVLIINLVSNSRERERAWTAAILDLYYNQSLQKKQKSILKIYELKTITCNKPYFPSTLHTRYKGNVSHKSTTFFEFHVANLSSLATFPLLGLLMQKSGDSSLLWWSPFPITNLQPLASNFIPIAPNKPSSPSSAQPNHKPNSRLVSFAQSKPPC